MVIINMSLRLNNPLFNKAVFTGSLLAVLSLVSCGGGGIGTTGDEQQPDAVIQDLPIVYVKRIIPLDDQGNVVPQDLRNPIRFNPGAQLILRELASPAAMRTS